MKRRSNFDRYLEEHLEDPEFAERFRKTGEAWDVALQIATTSTDTGYAWS
jgi:hypothetical protein